MSYGAVGFEFDMNKLSVRIYLQIIYIVFKDILTAYFKYIFKVYTFSISLETIYIYI
jgi:hypothetical protein